MAEPIHHFCLCSYYTGVFCLQLHLQARQHQIGLVMWRFLDCPEFLTALILQATSSDVARGAAPSSRADPQFKVEMQDPGSQTTSQPRTDVSAGSQAVLQPSSRWTTIDEDEEKQQLPQVCA